MSPAPAFAFADCETTGLDPRRHHAWEIAVIRRDADGHEEEFLWQVRPDLATADPEALKIGRFEERFAVPDDCDAAQFAADGTLIAKLGMPEVLFDLQDALRDTVLIGSNPAFDDAFLKKLLQAHCRKVGWHYRPIDIATLAAGYLYGQARLFAERDRDPDWYRKTDLRLGWPWKSYDASEAVGVPRPKGAVGHTALGDARWARDVWTEVVFPPMSHLFESSDPSTDGSWPLRPWAGEAS